MRLISQSGMLDIPYENVALSVGRKEGMYVIYGHTAYKNMPCVLGKYATKEKTVRVLEGLHKTYVGLLYAENIAFQFPSDEELEE